MTIINKIKSRVGAFRKDEQGAVLPLVGLAFMVMFMAAGFAIDYTRAQIVRERLQWAVDAGALAGAKHATGRNIGVVQREANAYFRANFPNGYMDTSGGRVNAQYIGTVNGRGEGIRFTVSDVRMENYFADIVGINDIKVSATADVNTLPLTPLDVVFSLDVSGSMDWRDGTGTQCLYAGGGGSGDANNNLGLCRCGAGPGFSNCPAQGRSRLVRAKAHIKRMRDTLESGNNRFALVPWDQRTHLANGNYRSGSNTRNCDFMSASPWACDSDIPRIFPLSNNRGQFNSRVDGLNAWGNTDHANGMYWAYETIKNSNRDNKVIIFMTDGWPTMNYNEPGNVFVDNAGGNMTQILNLFLSNCNRAKNNGVVIFTVLYNLDAGGDSRANLVQSYMRQCASKAAYAFDAGDNVSLGNALDKIGESMMTMRLTR